jgi:hypothetical protein
MLIKPSVSLYLTIRVLVLTSLLFTSIAYAYKTPHESLYQRDGCVFNGVPFTNNYEGKSNLPVPVFEIQLLKLPIPDLQDDSGETVSNILPQINLLQLGTVLQRYRAVPTRRIHQRH